jgi:hypothetical protein
MMEDDALLETLGIGTPTMSEARRDALRKQQTLGMLLGGSSVGGGNVGQMGRQMLKQASDELDPGSGSDFNNLMKVMQFQALQQNRDFQRQAAQQRREDTQLQRNISNQQRQEAQAWREQQAQEAQERRAAETERKQVTELSKRMEDSPLIEMEQQLKQIREDLAPYAEQGGDVDLPGYGKFESAIPDWLVSDEGDKLRASVGGLRNAILKARSGGAVTVPEANRLLAELGAAIGQDESLLLRALNNIQETLNQRLQAFYAPYSEDIQKQVRGQVWTPQGPVWAEVKEEEVTDLPSPQGQALPKSNYNRRTRGN